MEKCVLNCHKHPNDLTRVIQQKSLETVIIASRERDDGIHECLTGVLTLQVHEACYKSYIRQSNINAAKKRKASGISENEDEFLPGTSAARSKTGFNFAMQCVICCELAGDDYISKSRKKGRFSLGNNTELICFFLSLRR